MTESWTIQWRSIETRGDLLVLMFSQLTPHVETAIESGRRILDAEFNVGTASSFLFSASVVGDFFWPSPQRRRVLREAYPRRDRDMRHVVGLPDDQPPGLDSIRNDLTHVDERLEEMILEAADAPLLAWADGNSAPEGTRRYMNFERATGVLHSLGTEVDVTQIVAWHENLRARVARAFVPLVMKSPHLGRVDNDR